MKLNYELKKHAMTSGYDTIIWGASLKGLKKAIELKQQGKNVLVAGKFGFPGGQVTESLAALFEADIFSNKGFCDEILNRVKKINNGLLFQNRQWVLMHPEAVKRVCWELIAEHDIPLLFHVTPLSVQEESGLVDLELFGREGSIKLTAGSFIDLSDNGFLIEQHQLSEKYRVTINAFFTNPLPFELPGFRIIHRFDTPIGIYVSHSIRNVVYTEIETVFNRELDRLSRETWRKYKARILMVPVYPEILAEQNATERHHTGMSL